MASVIDSHPQRQKIIDGILAGQSMRAIGASVTPSVSAMAVMRYKRSVVGPALDGAGALAKALQSAASGNSELAEYDAKRVTSVALAADPLLSRIAKHQEVIDGVLVKAAGKGDARGTAALVSTDLKGLELQARLTGRLDSATHQTNIAIVIPAGSQPQIEAEISGDVIDIEPVK